MQPTAARATSTILANMSQISPLALTQAGLEARLRPPELIDAVEDAGDDVLSLNCTMSAMLHDAPHGMSFYYPTSTASA